ncbi:MAG: hypothetical protein WC208_14095 [Gallionella sp.]|jgi:hypothetical protein
MDKIINEIFAFVATETDGSEGIIGMNLDGQWFPLVGANMARVNSLYPVAKEIQLRTGRPFRVLKFSNKQDITEEVRRASEA